MTLMSRDKPATAPRLARSGRQPTADNSPDRHDHGQCVDGALDRAARLCRASGAQLTEIRRKVLALVWRGHAPIGAYEILEALRADGRAAQPPTVYRALDFLMAQGLVHRVASRNAFIGCAHPENDHGVQLLICRDCGTVTELADPAIGRALRRSADAAGFAQMRGLVEIEGVCAPCRQHG